MILATGWVAPGGVGGDVVEVFAVRARDAMLAGGIASVGDLSGRTARVRLITEQRLKEILVNPEGVTGRELVTLGAVLNVRCAWLMDGTGPMARSATGDPAEAEALILFASIPRAKIRFWFGMGRRLAR